MQANSNLPKLEKATKEVSDKFKFLEIERKFTYKETKWDSFVSLCRTLSPIEELEVSGPDTYYERPNTSEFLRWRYSEDLQELTIKQRHSKASTLVRQEIDLSITENNVKTVLKFIKDLGFTKLFRIRKTCHIFWFQEEDSTVSVVIYKVTCKNMEDRVFVEIEPEKGIGISKAKLLIRKYEKLLNLKPHQRINNSLLELYSNKTTPLITKEETITCIKCGDLKASSEFYPSWISKSGSKCADCCSQEGSTSTAIATRDNYLQERRKSDISFRLKERIRSRLNSAVKAKKKNGSAVKDLGCTIADFKEHVEGLFYESPTHGAMTWQNWGVGPGKWQLDHIVPLSSVDLTSRFDFLRVVHYSNIRPLWHEDHVLKTKKDLEKK